MTAEIKNRKSNDFEITETLEAGIILVGREIKSVAAKECDLTGARCIVKNDVLLVSSYIKLESDAYSTPYNPNRDRVLLLRKSEKRYLVEKIKKGFWVIPIKLYLKKSKYKLLIGIGKPIKREDVRDKILKQIQIRELRDIL